MLLAALRTNYLAVVLGHLFEERVQSFATTLAFEVGPLAHAGDDNKSDEGRLPAGLLILLRSPDLSASTS
jgi:hypothetical protein